MASISELAVILEQYTMIIRSIFRVIIIPLITFLIVGCGIVPYFFFRKIITKPSFQIKEDIFWLTLFVSLVFISIIVYILYIFIGKLLFIRINPEAKIILFRYPLIFQQKEYSSEQVVAFHFSVYHSKGFDTKVLRLKTSDNRVFSITDFETSNFREVENLAIEYFPLTKGKRFEKLTIEEKEVELLNNKLFEVKQAKDYRFSCYVVLVMIALIVIMELTIAIQGRRMGASGFLLVILIIIFCVSKIRRANATIQNYS